jgi:hypothetical protein
MPDEPIIPPAVPRLPQPEFPTGACTACGRPIVWAVEAQTGKRVPLDPAAPTYSVRIAGGDAGRPRTVCLNSKDHLSRQAARGDDTVRGVAIFVSHFSTCRNVEQIKEQQKAQQLELPTNKEPS